MIKNISKALCLLLSAALITSCTRTPIAPIEELEVKPRATFDFYYVASGDTLYSIAFLEKRDYKDLAKWNYLEPPYTLKRGQKVYINEPDDFYTNVVVPPQDPVFIPRDESGNVSGETPAAIPPLVEETVKKPSKAGGKSTFDKTWIWPVVNGYQNHTKSLQNNGLDISAARGSDVSASAAGTVVYAGNGLKGYGNMIIIKHNDQYLSAYAHNDTLHVAENEQVSQGQVIAYLGSTDSKDVKLHFEIRKDGEPIQPLTVLPKL